MIPNDVAFDGKISYMDPDLGTRVYRSCRLDRPGSYELHFRFVEFNSPYRQALQLSFSRDPKFKGKAWLNGEKLPILRKRTESYLFKEDGVPDNEFIIKLDMTEGYISLRNASNLLRKDDDIRKRFFEMTGRELDESKAESFTGGRYANAFWVEKLENHVYRFHCNDHEMDDDFNDFIFDLQVNILK